MVPGQYAHVVGKIEPTPVENDSETYEFVNDISQGRIPREYIPAVDKGFQRALVKGPLCECEVVGVKATLSDGSYHDVDSSEMAFNVAGFNCMRDALKKSNMALLEPIMKLEVEVPEEYQGSVSGHVAQKRGVINTSETKLGTSVFIAEVPLANMFDYANELRSMTQGKGGIQHGILPLCPGATKHSGRSGSTSPERKRRTTGNCLVFAQTQRPRFTKQGFFVALILLRPVKQVPSTDESLFPAQKSESAEEARGGTEVSALQSNCILQHTDIKTVSCSGPVIFNGQNQLLNSHAFSVITSSKSHMHC